MKARKRDNIQDLKIAQQLITRVRCHSRASGVEPKYSYATRKQRKTLDTAQKMIAEVITELRDDEV